MARPYLDFIWIYNTPSSFTNLCLSFLAFLMIAVRYTLSGWWSWESGRGPASDGGLQLKILGVITPWVQAHRDTPRVSSSPPTPTLKHAHLPNSFIVNIVNTMDIPQANCEVLDGTDYQVRTTMPPVTCNNDTLDTPVKQTNERISSTAIQKDFAHRVCPFADI